MKYDFDELVNRTGTSSVKWDYNQDYFGRSDILPMWVADMDFASAPEIVADITRVARLGVYGYTKRPNSYFQAIEGWLYRRHGWQVERDWIANTSGVVNGISIALHTFTRPGDRVLIQPPVYRPFFNVVEENGRQLVLNPLIEEDGRYTMDWRDLEGKFRQGVRMMILCSPHNPVGRVWSKQELKRLAELCLKYEVLVVSDEIWSDLVYKPHKHTPIATISKEMAPNSIVCLAPSKTFNLAGLNTSVVIIPSDSLREQFEATINAFELDMGNIFGIAALEAAYAKGEDWLEQLLIYLEDNFNYLKNRFAEQSLPVRVIQPEATYVAWLDFSELGMSHDKLVNFLVDSARLGLNDGKVFGHEGEHFMRINFACPRSILREGLDRLIQAINEL